MCQVLEKAHVMNLIKHKELETKAFPTRSTCIRFPCSCLDKKSQAYDLFLCQSHEAKTFVCSTLTF
jgi:hypothetical protein